MKINVQFKSKTSVGITKRVPGKVIFDNLGARLKFRRVVVFL